MATTAAPATTPSAPPEKTQAEPPHRTRHNRPRKPVGDDTIDALSPILAPVRQQIFLLAYPPAPGVSSIFETLCKQYSPSKSLQMILRRAFDDYEVMIGTGTFRAAPSSYPVLSETKKSPPVQTSRMVESDIIMIARSHFDPMKLETARAFGLKLATAALASFFAAEP